MRKGTIEYRRASIGMLLVGLAIFSSLYATQALLPTLTREMGIDPSTAALTVSAATGALAVCVVPASILSEKFGRGRVLVISALAATALGLTLPLAQSIEQLVVLRSLQGALLAGTPAVAMAWLSEELDERDLAGAMGLYIAGTSVGGLTGRLIPAFMLEVTDWRWALATSAAVSLALAVATAILLPEQRNFRPKASIRPGAEVRAVTGHLRNPRLVGLVATAFIAMGVFVSMYNFFGFRAINDFGLAPSLAGLTYVMYLSGTWSSARAGSFVSRFGRGRVVLAAAVLMLTGALIGSSGNLIVTLVGLLIFTASFFALHSTASGWVGLIAEKDRAEASSLYVFCYYMGSSLLGAATGQAFEALPWAGFVAVLAAMLGALIAIAVALAVAEKRSE
ncbi:MFS transporter [Corynebacterium hadale]|uniref:MFS transporter n=1 Tax=Corynebacterium hadale TaxID=2026255 RepID=UPI001EF1B775|nr:MFS transporter [Corynebacterium hadale]MCG7254998.1 MFS transporter [Corynebacterium hadale]MCG7257201.1 MFS transporter [Corynebacterium hadale]MCG7265905.1 MFS transporter [Corynebacterium hadale]